MSDKKFGPKMGGSMEIYREIREAGLKVGDTVRLHIPGLMPFEKEIVELPFADGPMVEIEGQRVFLSDRSNGHHIGDHAWRFQIEQKQPLTDEEIARKVMAKHGYYMADTRAMVLDALRIAKEQS